MNMPIIKEELIENVRNQQKRRGVAEYVQDSWHEISKENGILADSIFDSATNAASRITCIVSDKTDIELEDPAMEELFFLVANNILGVSCAVYKTIQQQIVCDELES